MPERSRLSRRMESQTKKRLFLNVAGILVILLLLLKFGIPIIVGISTFLSGTKVNSETTKKDDMFIQPPVLDPQPSATHSATITVTGTAYKDQTITLYLNGSKTDTTKTDKDGDFSFKDVTLDKGKNTIKTKATVDKKETSFSNEITIEYKNDPPTLTIEKPSDGQSFGKDDTTTDVTGKTDPGVKITVNGLWAIVEDNGAFHYTLRLQGGENKIKVVATDAAENKVEKEIKVNRSQ